MIISWDGSWYVARTQYADREIVKNAGFLWDPAVRTWKTKFPARAALLRPYCDDSALLQLAAHFAKLEASRATDSEIAVPAPDGQTYLSYQKAGIAYTLGRSGTLIADEPGLGKTIQALGVINATPSIRRVLVVCPTSLKRNWAKEAEKWLVNKEFEILVINAKRLPLAICAEAPDHGPVFVISNYERAVQLATELKTVAWDLVVLDEAHYIKNPRAKRSQAAYELAMIAKQRILLTGTPILNRPAELQPLAGLCDPERFGDPRLKRSPQCWSFLKRYCGAHQEMRGRKLVWTFDGATNLAELQERLRASIMVRRLKADVLAELPPKRRQVVPIEIENLPETPASRVWWASVQAAEAEAALAVIEADKIAYAEAAQKLRYLNQIAFTEMSEYRHMLGLAKVDTGVEYVHGLLDGGVDKIIVFAHHRDVIDLARTAFSALGLESVVLQGGMSEEDKNAAVERFQSDPQCRIFLGQIQAAGVGLTLTAATHVVFFELDWVPANTSQCEDRAHRIGQKGIVFVHHLVVDGGLDAHMVQKMVWKQEIAENALDTVPEYEEMVLPGSLALEPGLDRRGMPKVTTCVRKVPPELRQGVLRGLRLLAGMCDGAIARDDVGFNGSDSAFGHKLATLADLSDAQYYAGWRLLMKYRNTQLPKDLVIELGLDKKEAA